MKKLGLKDDWHYVKLINHETKDLKPLAMTDKNFSGISEVVVSVDEIAVDHACLDALELVGDEPHQVTISNVNTENKGVTNEISAETLLQVNATIITGVLIFLTVASLSSNLAKFSLAPLAYIVSAILITPFTYSAYHLLRPKEDINLREAREIMKIGLIILIALLVILAIIISIINWK
jgi:hypothetical protein